MGRTPVSLAIGVVLAVILAACGGGGGSTISSTGSVSALTVAEKVSEPSRPAVTLTTATWRVGEAAATVEGFEGLPRCVMTKPVNIAIAAKPRLALRRIAFLDMRGFIAMLIGMMHQPVNAVTRRTKGGGKERTEHLRE